MFTVYSFKSRFQKLLNPIIDVLYRKKITPNQVTLFTVFISVVFGLYFFVAGVGSWFLMPFVFLLRMALNAIDGMLARMKHQESKIGIYYNELGDMVGDLFLYLPFVTVFPVLGWGVIFLSLFSEVIGILGAVVGFARRYDGPMGKSDRAFYLGLLGFFLSLQSVSLFQGSLALGGVVFFLLITCWIRMKKGIL